MKAIKQEYQMYTGFLAEKWQMYAAFLIVLLIWHLHSYFRYRMNFQHKENADTESDVISIRETFDDAIEIDSDSEIDEAVDDSMFFEHIGLFNVKEIKSDTYIAPNFQFKEFKSKDGVMPTQQELDNIVITAAVMQVVRDYFNSGKVQLELQIVNALHVTSGHRSARRNAQTEGSAPGSYHVPGMAVDFRIAGYTPKQVYIVMEHLIKINKIPKGGLAVYSNHVHYDIRGFNARW